MKKIKSKKIIIYIILFIFLFIVVCVCGYLLKLEKQKQAEVQRTEQLKQQVKQYTNVSEFNSIEEVLLYLNSEFISEENSTENSEDSEIDIIVKAKLKYDASISNKNYYKKLIEYSADACNYKNFCIIDEEKNIKVIVICNEAKSILAYYINNEKFYFEKLNSIDNISKAEEKKQITITDTCELLNKIISNNWTTRNIDLGTKESVYNYYDIYFDEGYEIRTINGKIYNIVFTNKYSDNVVNELNTLSTEEEIINKLGTPLFETNKCKGYITSKYYIFFSKEEISIYPIYDYSTDEIIKIIEKNNGTSDISTYLNEIKQIWKDYDIYKVGSNYEILQYTLKGIAFKYNNTPNQGIVLYNNYKGKIDLEHTLEDVKNKVLELPENVNFVNEDLVFLEELNRINSIIDYSENDNFSGKNIVNISKKFKIYQNEETQQISFISINKENANSELREKINYGIWQTDYNFIYSISGKGIYMYNAKECRYTTIIEGNNEFKLIQIENNILSYDNTTIEL